MPVLRLRCTKCSQPVDTGYDVDFDTFLALSGTERTLECPYCEKTQTWRLDDVEPLGVQAVS